MDAFESAFTACMDYLQQGYEEGRAMYEEYEEQEEERFTSSDPNSERMRIIEQVLYSEDAYRLGLMLIARDQLWESQINRYGEPLPLYKPRTIRYKAKRGFPPDKMVRYTEFDKGAFYNEGIAIEVDRANDFFDFYITDRRGYFAFIPDDVVGLTDDNEYIFKAQIEEWVNEIMYEEWLNNER